MISTVTCKVRVKGKTLRVENWREGKVVMQENTKIQRYNDNKCSTKWATVYKELLRVVSDWEFEFGFGKERDKY